MTDHPCKGMTTAAIHAFEAIAVNQQPHCSRATLQKLVDHGLVVRQDRLMRFRDGLPALRIDDYYVPLPIHHQWCEWASAAASSRRASMRVHSRADRHLARSCGSGCPTYLISQQILDSDSQRRRNLVQGFDRRIRLR